MRLLLRAFSAAIPAAVALAAGCSDNPISSISGEASLGCGYFEDPNNCWYRAASEAYACGGSNGDAADGGASTDADGGAASGVQGKLAADGKSCTHTNGDLDAFDAPLTPEGGALPFGITGTRAGKSCFHFVHTEVNGQNHVDLATASGTVKLDYNDKSYSITCPDGKKLSASGLAFIASFTCNKPPPDGQVDPIVTAGRAIPNWKVPHTPHERFDIFPHPTSTGTQSLSRCEP